MNEQLAVVAGPNNDIIRFKGTRDECYAYMRTHSNWNELRYIKNGELWRLSSWVLS